MERLEANNAIAASQRSATMCFRFGGSSLLLLIVIASSNPPTQRVVAQGVTASTAAIKETANQTKVRVAQVQKQVVDIWTGGSNSLVARAVGRAEGTRTVEGGKTSAYVSHTDPGNGVRNQGTFSYQHSAVSPEDADAKQLRRLQGQFEVIKRQAKSRNIKLNLEVALNAIDLANQAPLAALDQGGIAARLHEVKQKGVTGEEAIIQARSNSFINPSTGRLEAPGLGNSHSFVRHDQSRRTSEIKKVLNYEGLKGTETPK